MKIYLCDLSHDMGLRVRAVPLGIASLACAVKDSFGESVKIELFVYPQKLIKKLKSDPPDIIALSNYTWNSKLSLKVVKIAKKINPNILTVMGGSHCRQDSKGLKDFLDQNPTLDAYIPFEGEAPFAALVERCLEKNTYEINKLGIVPGTYLNVKNYEFKRLLVESDKTKQVYNSPYYTINRYSSPYLTGMLDEFLADPKLSPMLESNRGCPYSCTFCAWGTGSGNKLIRKNEETFLKEIWYVGEKTKNDLWFLADSNFGILKDDIKIAKNLKLISEKFGSPKQIYYNTAKNNAKLVFEVANILGTLTPINMSVQTFDPVVLKNMKRKNLKHEEIIKYVKMHHEKGRKINTDLLVPSGGETLESHLNSLRTSFDVGFDEINTNIINMLPGTEMESDADRNKYGFKTMWSPMDSGYGIYDDEFIFETDECIMSSNHISEEEMYNLKKVHFLTLMLWMVGFGKPLLKLALKNNINPTDVILALSNDKNSPISKKVLNPLVEEYRNEWFKSEEDLIKFYSKKQISKNPYTGEIEMKKLNLKYLSHVIVEKKLVYETIDEIKKYLQKNSKISKKIIDIVYKISLDNLKLDLLNDQLVKKIKYEASIDDYENLIKANIISNKSEYKDDAFIITYDFSKAKFDLIKNKLKQCHFDKKPKDAVYTTILAGGLKFIYLTNTNFTSETILKKDIYKKAENIKEIQAAS